MWARRLAAIALGTLIVAAGTLATMGGSALSIAATPAAGASSPHGTVCVLSQTHCVPDSLPGTLPPLSARGSATFALFGFGAIALARLLRGSARPERLPGGVRSPILRPPQLPAEAI